MEKNKKKVEYINLYRCVMCEKYRNKNPHMICEECKKDSALEKQYNSFVVPKKVKKPKKTKEEFTTSKVEKYLETKPEGATVNQIAKDMKLPKNKVRNSIHRMARRMNSTRVVSEKITIFRLQKK